VKYFQILIMFIFILFMTACSGNNYSSASMFTVVEKGYAEDYSEAWIIGFDPAEDEQVNIKVMVDDFMIWNLIEENRTYFTTFVKKGENPWHLEQINHHDDYDTLR